VKRTGLEHGAGEVAHQGTSLEMEVAKHDIGAPTANKLDDTGVDTATEQGHGATGTTRASWDVVGIETELRTQDTCGGPDAFGNQFGGNGTPFIGPGTADNAERGLARGTVEAKVADAVDNADDRTGIDVTGSGMSDNLATNTIFLGSKGERDERNAVEVSKITRERVKASIADEQLHVAETEQVILCRTAVFAGSQKPKECHVAQVRHYETDLVAMESS
jgi:hypothetical protein